MAGTSALRSLKVSGNDHDVRNEHTYRWPASPTRVDPNPKLAPIQLLGELDTQQKRGIVVLGAHRRFLPNPAFEEFELGVFVHEREAIVLFFAHWFDCLGDGHSQLLMRRASAY